MRVRMHVILAAAVVAVTLFGPSNASAWGYSQHGYGTSVGYGRHFGFGRHYGFGRNYRYGHRHYRYGRRHYRYGRRHYYGRSYGLPPAHSRSPRARTDGIHRGPRVELPGLHDNGRRRRRPTDGVRHRLPADWRQLEGGELKSHEPGSVRP